MHDHNRATNTDGDQLGDAAVALVRRWLKRANEIETPEDKATMDQLEGVVVDPAGVSFVMAFVDRVVRPDDDQVAAAQLVSIVRRRELPGFLSSVDKLLLQAGARLAPLLPKVVMPLARRRMRSIVGHLVAPAEPAKLARHLADQRSEGYALNVNLLGEAVLGGREAQRRLDELLALLDQPDVDYVSVKISAVAAQLNHWAHADSLDRVTKRLRILIDRASKVEPPTFVNFDMEEYEDLELTLAAFMQVLGDPAYKAVDAGIVLQAYLPDAFDAMQRLVTWANERHADGGGTVKIRLVKGANLAMEQVDAAMHGWEQAPFDSKVKSDASYKRCLDWLLQPERMTGVRLGLASHNLFDIAWTHLLATERGVQDRVQFEMLQGMAPAQAQTVAEATAGGPPLLLYTPAVKSVDFDVAISYLFRRLEENASDDNFLRHLFEIESDPAAFALQEGIFEQSLLLRHELSSEPHRQQDRREVPIAAYEIGQPFQNEADTDPILRANQEWIDSVLVLEPTPLAAPLTDTIEGVDAILETARSSAAGWAATSPVERQRILHRVGDELARHRGDLIATMMHEANKTFAQGDVEISEAIDFARYYGDRAVDLGSVAGTKFAPFGVVGVIPPWNFPVAIPAGGVLSALAAGNAVIFKPAPETPRSAQIIANACWAAGVPKDVLQFVRTPDDEVGKRLVTGVDAVILTGSTETAALFRSWKPDMRLFAETSGKNALIITPSADLDLAVDDLVQSAFGHAGQKCSAASLAILVGDVYESDRFRRQLADAAESLELGASTRIETTMASVVGGVNPRLQQAFDELEPGESWLVKPAPVQGGDDLWSPGVRLGVSPGSWFHRTECFGPVLGLMHARDLDHALEIQNSSSFGLTGGIHTLDPAEIAEWVERVEVGNAYINRAITGAIVQRQPFGGWKKSSVGPGAKAGGPNYVMQLGTFTPTDHGGVDDYAQQWVTHFDAEHDPSDLFCEANVFRYRPLARVGLRVGAEASALALDRVRHAAQLTGTTLIESYAADEDQDAFASRLATTGVERVRVVGEEPSAVLRIAANEAGVHLAAESVTGSGRIELLHYLREQAVSRTLHRFGNLVDIT